MSVHPAGERPSVVISLSYLYFVVPTAVFRLIAPAWIGLRRFWVGLAGSVLRVNRGVGVWERSGAGLGVVWGRPDEGRRRH